MDRLSYCVEVLHSRWLASSINCCFPRLPAQSEPDLPGASWSQRSGIHVLIEPALDKYHEICCDQPQPKFDISALRPDTPTSHRASQWLTEGRNLASRASSRASFTTKRTASRRPTIGAPSDFRIVESPSGRNGGFRPLELSIYMPGNTLPSLPSFHEDYREDEAGLEFPAQALTKARSDSMLSRPSTSFTVPRKPVASMRTLSLDVSRSSVDSRYAMDLDLNLALGTRSLHRRPGIATTQSTQDFLDTLDARLPQPPRLRSKSGPEPIYTLYRRASEQSLRLRTHLEERERIERHLPDCDTILEEKPSDVLPKFPNLSPISSHGDAADDLPQHPYSYNRHDSTQSMPTPFPTNHLHSQASLHKFLDVLPEGQQQQQANSVSARARISQWLLRSSSSPRPPDSENDVGAYCPSTIRDRASTVSTLSTVSNAAELATPWTTPRSSPRRKRSSFSSCRTGTPGRGLDFGTEKVSVGVRVVDVGLAF